VSKGSPPDLSQEQAESPPAQAAFQRHQLSDESHSLTECRISCGARQLTQTQEKNDLRKLFLIASLALLLPASALAQDTPKAEVFGGYSYLRGDGDGDPGFNLHGWNASVAGNLNKWFGLVLDFSGHYGGQSVTINTTRVRFDANSHSYLAGPRFSYRGNEKMTPFFHALFGGVRAHGEGSLGSTNFSVTDTAFGMALGGGLDVKVHDKIAIRLIQADYLLTRFDSSNQNNARVSAGIVFRLGSR
jgi:opacity protein-like surface antigen